MILSIFGWFTQSAQRSTARFQDEGHSVVRVPAHKWADLAENGYLTNTETLFVKDLGGDEYRENIEK